MIRAMLFDLDGVLRFYPQSIAQDLEHQYALTPGLLARCVFAPEVATPVIRGDRTREAWIVEAGARVGNEEAVRAFLSSDGVLDLDVLDLVKQVRAGGVKVGLLTNATNTLRAEVAQLSPADVLSAFDVVYNSSEIGAIKPEPGIYRHAMVSLGMLAAEIGFVDDRLENVEGAVNMGMQAHCYTEVEALRRWINARVSFELGTG